MRQEALKILASPGSHCCGLWLFQVYPNPELKVSLWDFAHTGTFYFPLSPTTFAGRSFVIHHELEKFAFG